MLLSSRTTPIPAFRQGRLFIRWGLPSRRWRTHVLCSCQLSSYRIYPYLEALCYSISPLPCSHELQNMMPKTADELASALVSEKTEYWNRQCSHMRKRVWIAVTIFAVVCVSVLYFSLSTVVNANTQIWIIALSYIFAAAIFPGVFLFIRMAKLRRVKNVLAIRF